MTTKQRKRIRRTTGLAGLVLAASLLCLAPAALAQDKWYTIVPECAREKTEVGKAPDVPTLNCVLLTFGNIAMVIFGLSGSLALLMFVYGGFTMVTSGGNQEKVARGKTILRNSVIGILIIMTSGLLVQYAMGKLGVKQSEELMVVGQACGAGKQVVQMADGSFACVGKCDELGPNYSCQNTDPGQPGYGKYCIAALCPGQPRNIVCCFTPPPQ